MKSHQIYTKLVVSLGVCMFLALTLNRMTLDSMEVRSQGVYGRVGEAIAALSKIVKEPNDLVFFYGSSMTRAGFSPRKFDAELADMGKDVTSFNYGFGGLNPYFQDFLSRRIADTMVENDRRIKLAMIEFNPFQTTQTRWNRSKPVLDSYLTLLASDSELVDESASDVTRMARLFSIKYLRDAISAEMVTTYFGRELFPGPPWQVYKDDESVVAERRKLGNLLRQQFDKEFPNYEGANWSYQRRGGGLTKKERSDESLALIDQYYEVSHTDNQMKNDRLSRIRTADIEELHFEPLLVEHFINTVKNFQAVSDNVEVILLPKNSKWIHTTKEGEKRLAEAIKQIELATGVTIKNHQNIAEITSDMYRDTTHLARYRGDVAYTDYLLKQYHSLF